MKKTFKSKIKSYALFFILTLMLSYIVIFYLVFILIYQMIIKLLVCLLITITVSTFLYLHYLNRIYKPIAQYEDALNMLYENNKNFVADSPINPNNLMILINNWKNSLQREFETTLSGKQATLMSLQSQINPHFLYNTLDSIRGEALECNARIIAEMTEALSAFFRYSVSKDETIVPLQEELRNVDAYFKIQRYRFYNRFKLNIYNAVAASSFEYYLPKLTLQPIVENSIYHGLELTSGEGIINIRITATNNRLLINISDNGVGMDLKTLNEIQEKLSDIQISPIDKNKESTGIALFNINQRIKLLYGDAYGLFISSQPDVGTEVEIVLPLVQSGE